MRVKQLHAPRGGKGATARHAVMFVHGEEAVTIHHEKDPDDPRVADTAELRAVITSPYLRPITTFYRGGKVEKTEDIMLEYWRMLATGE